MTFELTRSLDIAAVDIQNRVSAVTGRLPNEVKTTGVVITKIASSFVLGAGVFARDNRYSPGLSAITSTFT